MTKWCMTEIEKMNVKGYVYECLSSIVGYEKTEDMTDALLPRIVTYMEENCRRSWLCMDVIHGMNIALAEKILGKDE